MVPLSQRKGLVKDREVM